MNKNVFSSILDKILPVNNRGKRQRESFFRRLWRFFSGCRPHHCFQKLKGGWYMGKNPFKRSGFSTRDESGGTNQKKILDSGDIESMEKGLEAVNRFLKLKGNDRLSNSVKQCFETWVELFGLREKNDRAEIVLSAYYSKEKIRDTLIRLKEFVERMDTVDCDETAREMGYYNYIFFLEQYMNAMRIQYDDVALCRKMPDCEPDNVAWFINEECGQIGLIKDLPKLRTAASQMLELAKDGKKPSERFRDIISDIRKALKPLEPEKKDDRKIPTDESYEAAIAELKELKDRLEKRKEALYKNINKGTELYGDLTADMKDEWFQQFDPKTDPVQGMTRERVKTFYQDCLSKLKFLEDEKG